MYFTQKMKKELINKVLKENYNLYAIKLRSGIYTENAEELQTLVNLMFEAWKRIVMSRSWGYLKNYDGIIKRLLFTYSPEKGGYEPYFYLLCLRKRKNYKVDEEYKIRIEEEKLKMQTYIKWFSAWATALKLCTSTSVGFSLVELDRLEKLLAEYFTNEKYTLVPLLEETRKELLKIASGNGTHKLVSFHGICRYKNRHVSVER